MIMRTLLLGNGINLTNLDDNSFLNIESIYKRFIVHLDEYWDIIQKLVYLKDIDIKKLINQIKERELRT